MTTVHTCDWNDAIKLSNEYPDTFEYPHEYIKHINIGDSVKISSSKYNERFWVKITDITDDIIHGIVSNELLYNSPYQLNSLIKFKKCNIYAVNFKKSLEAFHKFLDNPSSKNIKNCTEPHIQENYKELINVYLYQFLSQQQQ